MEHGNIFSRFARTLTRTKKLKSEPEDILLTQLRRCLTTFDITLIGISSTLGSGIYILAGEVSAKTGAAIIISITLAAIASILCGLCYTEFAARVPKAGSAYVYSYVVIGEFFAFVVGWNLILEYGIGAASVIKGFTTYVDALTHGKIKNYTIEHIGQPEIFGSKIYIDFFSFFISMIITTTVALSVKKTSFINSLCTIVNIIVIVMVVAMGSFYADVKNIKDFMPNGIDTVITGASSCFFAFIGFDAVCMVSEEAKKPNKSVPISVVTTILTCYFGFVAAALVLNMMIPHSEMHGSASLATAFDYVGLHPGKYIISIGAIFGLLGNAIASMMMMPRFLYSMSQDGLIFKVFSKVHESSNIPLFSTIFGGLLTGVMTLFLELHALVEMVSIGTILAYTLVTLSVLILRYKTDHLGMIRARTSRTLSGLSGISFSHDGTIIINPRLLEEEKEHDDSICEEENKRHSAVEENGISFSHDGTIIINPRLLEEEKEHDDSICEEENKRNSAVEENSDSDFHKDEQDQSDVKNHETGEQDGQMKAGSSVERNSGHLLSPSESEELLIYSDSNEIRNLIFSSMSCRQNVPIPFPTPTTQFMVVLCSVLVMFEILGLSAILHFLKKQLFHGDIPTVLLFSILLISLFITTLVISFMPQNSQRLFFKVPMLPWLPVFALFLNIYIMFGLNKLTWIRFGVWMAVGLIVYFTYGCRHSIQKDQNDEEVPINEDISEHYDEHNEVFHNDDVISA